MRNNKLIIGIIIAVVAFIAIILIGKLVTSKAKNKNAVPAAAQAKKDMRKE